MLITIKQIMIVSNWDNFTEERVSRTTEDPEKDLQR